ncbi:MAG: ribbon-helix-helix domain-containing protein [Pseudonocardia sp.]|nr:ribbon-helix-helix domain-containing protein [Pseudonocardia sp.]
MTIQITVRLPDELVAFVDAQIERGAVSSRADAVAKALVRERRRQAALADVAILRREATDPDLDALAEYGTSHPVALDD